MILRAPSGHRCGESHPKVRLSDAQVREMRAKHQRDGWGYVACSKHFGCGISTARDILTYRTRVSA